MNIAPLKQLTFAALLLTCTGRINAQSFTSGPIPLCTTSTFTANVSGIGWLGGPWTPWSSWLESVTINITSDHPQSLSIALTSPQGTNLVLSAFNGTGGQNYTGTTFYYNGGGDITTGTAPFTGAWWPQGGSLGVFDGEYADGTWTITVIDTACASGGPGGPWTPGWFDGAGSSGIAFGFSSGPQPCMGGIPWGQAVLCPGETVDILAWYSNQIPWYSYSIDPWGPPVPDPTAVSAPGSYSIEAMDPIEGCWYSATFDVIANPAVDLGADLLVTQCSNDGAVDLTTLFSIAPGTDAWWRDGVPVSNGSVTAVTQPGNYQVVGGYGTNCSDTAMVVLSFASSPDLGTDQSVSTCAGSSVDLTALYNTSGLSSEWYREALAFTTPTNATTAGSYTLVATNVAGCSDTALVELNIQAQVTLGADQVLSFCDNTTADLTPLFNTNGLSTTWTRLGAPVADPSAIIAGGTYTLIAGAGAACGDTASVLVETYLAPHLAPDMMASVCAGEGENLVSYFSSTGLSTEWTLDGAMVPDPTAALLAGTYRLVATNTEGCSDTAFVALAVDEPPSLGPDQNVTACANSPVDLTGIYDTGANASLWTLDGSTVNDPVAANSAGDYTITVTNAVGCSTEATVSLSFTTAPSLGADQQSTICTGATADLTSLFNATGFTAIWTRNGTPVLDPTAVFATGSYRLVVLNAVGCSDTAFVQLTVEPPPALGPDRSFALCPWGSVDLTTLFAGNSANATYLFNDAPVSAPTAVSAPGVYTITITNAGGCSDEALATISSMECRCEADFVQDVQCAQIPAQFTLLADSTILGAHWDFGSASPPSNIIHPLVTFIPGVPVIVTLEATLSCGVVQVQREIVVPDCSEQCNVWMPTSFTPDGDARNDAWTWQGECMPEDFSMSIFDRLGEVVFSTTDPKQAWDGSFGGRIAPAGVYAYRGGYRLPYQKRKQVMGSITLVR